VTNGMRSALRSTVAAVAMLAITAPAAAQPPVRIVGQVQWVAAEKIVVMTERGQSIVVDLTRADQSTYRALRAGEWIVVDGTFSRDGRQVIARDIWRDHGRGGWTQAP
jgi:hypothetical protein